MMIRATGRPWSSAAKSRSTQGRDASPIFWFQWSRRNAKGVKEGSDGNETVRILAIPGHLPGARRTRAQRDRSRADFDQPAARKAARRGIQGDQSAELGPRARD